MNLAAKLASSTLALGLMLSGGAANALEIDAYDGTGPYDLNAAQTDTDVGVSTSGFSRTLTAITSAPDTNVQIDSGANLGLYAHSQDSGIFGNSYIEYALGGVDLTEVGTQNGMRMELFNVDLNGLIGVEIDGVRVDLNTTDIVLGNGGVLPSFADYLFSDFAGIDATNVSALRLHIDGSNTDALDASIDSVGTICSSLDTSGPSGTDQGGNIGVCRDEPPPGVPAPGVIALMGLGLAGLGAVRRRKA